MDDSASLLAEQREYYRERTHEYDDWWERCGRYDKGSAYRSAWEADIGAVRRALEVFGPSGHVLEIAGGTGNWSRELANHAAQLTIVDQSPESIEVNRAKLATSGFTPAYIEADVFDFEPPEAYDVVFFSFWQSHVPPSHFEVFWAMVRNALRPGGRVFLIDNAHPDLSAGIHAAPVDVHTETVTAAQRPVDLLSGVATRTLDDGRRFEIVKRYWRPTDYEPMMAELGWTMIAAETEHFFFFASGQSTDQR